MKSEDVFKYLSLSRIEVDVEKLKERFIVFGLFKADAAEFTAENAILTATSDENGNFGFDKIPYGKYIVTEIEAPAGYIFSDKTYEVEISEDGEVVSLTAVNESTHLNVSKKDIYGKELAGAAMQIIDSEGNIFDEWISGEEVHTVTNIPVGSYILKETASPEGYVIATEIAFSIDKYNKVTVDSVNAVSTYDEGDPTITMVDDTTKVHVSKRDITTEKELPGAKLIILDENGETVEEWVSTNEEHIIEGKLTAGKEYTLREITAPAGYEKATDVTFKVNEDGTVTQVIMYDKQEDTPDSSTPDDSTPETRNPRTGVENTQNRTAVVLVSASLTVILMFILRRKNKNGKH